MTRPFPVLQILSTTIVMALVAFSAWWISVQKVHFSGQVPNNELFPKYDETNRTVNTYLHPPVEKPKFKDVHPVSDVFNGATVYGEWEVLDPTEGTATRFQLIRSRHKYPLLMVSRKFSGAGVPLNSGEVWVADHVLVKLNSGYGSQDLQNLARSFGAEIRSWTRLSDIYSVAFDPYSEGAVFKVMEKLRASPIVQSVDRDFFKYQDHP